MTVKAIKVPILSHLSDLIWFDEEERLSLESDYDHLDKKGRSLLVTCLETGRSARLDSGISETRFERVAIHPVNCRRHELREHREFFKRKLTELLNEEI